MITVAIGRQHWSASMFSETETIAAYLLIDGLELPPPASVVEERSQVEAVVIRTVALGVVGRRHCGHLVTVHRVHPEKTFDLLSHLKEKTKQ